MHVSMKTTYLRLLKATSTLYTFVQFKMCCTPCLERVSKHKSAPCTAASKGVVVCKNLIGTVACRFRINRWTVCLPYALHWFVMFVDSLRRAIYIPCVECMQASIVMKDIGTYFHQISSLSLILFCISSCTWSMFNSGATKSIPTL